MLLILISSLIASPETTSDCQAQDHSQSNVPVHVILANWRLAKPNSETHRPKRQCHGDVTTVSVNILPQEVIVLLIFAFGSGVGTKDSIETLKDSQTHHDPTQQPAPS